MQKIAYTAADVYEFGPEFNEIGLQNIIAFDLFTFLIDVPLLLCSHLLDISYRPV